MKSVVLSILLVPLGFLLMACNQIGAEQLDVQHQSPETSLDQEAAVSADSEFKTIKDLGAIMSITYRSKEVAAPSKTVYIGIDNGSIIDAKTRQRLGSISPRPKFTLCYEVEGYKLCDVYVADRVEEADGKYAFVNLRADEHFTEE